MLEKLRIYQTSLQLTKRVYELISNHEKLRKDFSLSDQLKRASVSVTLNIAEGNARGTRQFKNYLRISSGSCNEVVACMEIVQLVHKVDTKGLNEDYLILAKQISAFSKSFQ